MVLCYCLTDQLFNLVTPIFELFFQKKRGTQYRHGIYYHTDEQKEIAERIVESYGEDCVTEVKPANVFYDAELYHQQYLLKGGQSARKGEDTAIRCYG